MLVLSLVVSARPLLTRIKVGTLDDTKILDNLKMDAELFVGHRPKWVGTQESAAQKPAM